MLSMDEITIIYSNRKTLCLEVDPQKGVIVRAPKRAGKKEIQAFVLAHSAWIEKATQRVAERQSRLPQYPESAEEIAALKQRAAAVIAPKVEQYAALLGVTPTKVSITSAKKRFGSCSGKDALNFSCFLMLYSEKAIDYVVVHELCHIVHKNHSKAFYALVASVMPDYRQAERELKGRQAQ
ncbi:MAG: M48 family metallopeptidase [Clostridia bacterium]|nr:M48 family metallopeptidase [Clostridia bacterium]